MTQYFVDAPGRALMRRTFQADVLTCRRWGGRLRVIARVVDPAPARQRLATQRPPDTSGAGPPACAFSQAG